jgi:hypothetical protein
MTLQDYLFRVRKFLRDSQARFWDDPTLIIYINQARQDLVRDSCCCKALTQISLSQGQEAYAFQAILSAVQAAGFAAQQILFLASVKVYWSSNYRPPMVWCPWPKFDALYRPLVTMQAIPAVWSAYDYQTFYVAPIPNNTYLCDIDAVYAPNDLVNYNDTEVGIPYAWQNLVPIKAAYWAQHYERAFNIRDDFDKLYSGEIIRVASIHPAWRVPSFFGNPG